MTNMKDWQLTQYNLRGRIQVLEREIQALQRAHGAQYEETLALRKSVAQAQADAKEDGESVLALALALAAANALLDQVKRLISDRTLVSDGTLRHELARLLSVDVKPLAPAEDAIIRGRTAAEQRVLDACAAMNLGEDDPDADPLEPQEVGEDCYIYTDDQAHIVRAELARRGVK